MENDGWKMDTHFPFSIYDEKWKMKNGHPILFFIFQMENRKWVSIFDFSFSICDGKYKMGNWKSHENDNTYPGPAGTITAETVTHRTESTGGLGMLAPVPFKTLG